MDLKKRFAIYYKISALKRENRAISRALLKYGHKNFTLEIIEYCPKIKLIEREQLYLDSLKPEYNILKFAYSMLGYKHTSNTIALLKLKRVSEQHKKILSLVHTNKIVSAESRDKLSVAIKNYRKNNFLSASTLANIRMKTLAREGVAVTVLNIKTSEYREFTNQTEASLFVGITRQGVYNAIKRGNIVKGIYLIIKKVAI